MNFSTYTQALNFLNLPKKVYDEIIELNNNHTITKYHKETLLEHLFECGKQCIQLSEQFKVNPEIAFWVGFLHDIGKPFTKKSFENRKKKCIFTGHAQIGTRLVSLVFKNELDTSILTPLLWAIDNHMCCCSHNADISIIDKFNDLLLSTLPDDNKISCINFATMLFAADNLSRITDETIDRDITIKNALNIRELLINKIIDNVNFIQNVCNNRNITNERVIIINLGLSGSGKSTFSKNLIDKLPQYNVAHIERDTCYYETAIEFGMDVTDKLYSEVYNYVQEKNEKSTVQNKWITKLNDSLEDLKNQVIIIDSVQPLHNGAWTNTINSLSEEAKVNFYSSIKIGAYMFPISQLGIEFKPKTNLISNLPDNSLWFPNVNLELGDYDRASIDIGTGFIDNIPTIVKRYLETDLVPSCNLQSNIIELLNNNDNDLEKVIKLFPKDLITKTIEFTNKQFDIISLSYNDGMQVFNGPSRDYRGEVLLRIKNNNIYDNAEWHLLRGALPVFPDFATIEKDPAVFPYIMDIIDDCMPNRLNWFKNIQPKKAKYYLTYKHDGSLFNLTFIPSVSPRYLVLTDLIEQLNDKLIIQSKLGIFIFGSKGRFFITDQNPVKIRIVNAIKGSYGSLEDFKSKIEDYIIYHNLCDEQITFHFEAIDELPTSELTVYYGKAWCPFLGYTVFSDCTKIFYLPDMDIYTLPVNTPIFEFNNWKEIINFSKENYNKLLDGNEEIEPEGYVVHIFDDDNNKWYPVKLKYEFYYIAHKPNNKRNIESAKLIQEDNKYTKLRNRLAKFRNKPELETLLKFHIESWFNTINQDELTETIYENKKNWAIYWSAHRSTLSEYDTLIQNEIKYYYPNIKIKLFDRIMKLHPNKIDASIILNEIILDNK